MKKIITSLALTAMISLGIVTPALADGAASTRNIIFGAGAVYGLIQLNHNKHAHQMNVNLYKMHRMGTFNYNGKLVRCEYYNNEKKCYEYHNGNGKLIPNN